MRNRLVSCRLIHNFIAFVHHLSVSTIQAEAQVGLFIAIMRRKGTDIPFERILQPAYGQHPYLRLALLCIYAPGQVLQPLIQRYALSRCFLFLAFNK